MADAYDAVADHYAAAFGDELAVLTLDREVLDAAMAAVGSDAGGTPGWVLEAGCGPAPAAAHLADRPARLLGIDLSAAMLAVARARTPTVLVARGDIAALPLRDGCCSLVVLYCVLQHVVRSELVAVLSGLRRALAEGGVLVLAAHLGEGEVYVDDLLGHRVEPFGGTMYRRAELVDGLATAGFDVELERQRGPLDHEYPSQRLYVVARARGQAHGEGVSPG